MLLQEQQPATDVILKKCVILGEMFNENWIFSFFSASFLFLVKKKYILKSVWYLALQKWMHAYLTLQVCNLFSVLRVDGLRQQGVQVHAHLLLPLLFILHLDEYRNIKINIYFFISMRCCAFRVSGSWEYKHEFTPFLPASLYRICRRRNICFNLCNTLSKLRLVGLWELRVETLRDAHPAALLIFTLREENNICHQEKYRFDCNTLLGNEGFTSIVQETVFTSLCISVISRANWISEVSGSWEYREEGAPFTKRLGRQFTCRRERGMLTASQKFVPSESTNCCSSPSSLPPCTCSEEQTEFHHKTHPSIYHLFILSCINPSILSDLAEHLRQLLDKLSLCGFWQQRVKRGGNLLFVLHLEHKQHKQSLSPHGRKCFYITQINTVTISVSTSLCSCEASLAC
ncbi:hypothetical protein F7725_028951 [Dissostichus mawsoni]|uniref:Uncharacterized protein n=1 Tax=Dissostichus mawsoni TaxID=36200 RepID=A0A7J5XHU1_DISMA|nr:hypothetical protein F7725_028951 [Dissostichus mawsoni]